MKVVNTYACIRKDPTLDNEEIMYFSRRLAGVWLWCTGEYRAYDVLELPTNIVPIDDSELVEGPFKVVVCTVPEQSTVIRV